LFEHDSHESDNRFALLHQLSQTFNSSLDLKEVLELVMDEVVKAIGAERGFIALLDEGGELDFRTARGIDHTTIDRPEFEISRGVVEKVAQHGEQILTSDAQQDDRFSSRRSVLDLGLRSILCTPLKIKGNIIGVIYVDNRLFAGIFTDDDLKLLNAIASIAAIAIENARLYQVAVEKGRMESELQMAYQVQSSLIPDSLPKISGWEFAVSWRPAREVSGDFYDFIQGEEEKLSLIIADVTDKGVPAALFMALTRSIVRASIDQVDSPAGVISRANHLICADSTSNMPVTLFFGQLDTATGELKYVNAGHNPPIYFNAAKDEFIDLVRTGMFLGFDDNANYEQASLTMDSRDFIVCYTDGVSDAINNSDEMFGMERFQAIIRENCHTSAIKLLEKIEKSITEFIGVTALYDDLTILIAKRL
jgi:sigma-B regulation protein RsbU (phosphoserine phosphatase)